MFKLVISLFYVLCVLSPRMVNAQRQYAITDLGTLGGLSTYALDVNNSRQVSGNSTITAADATADGATGSRLRAFSWSGGGMTNLGALPDAGANQFARGYAINDAGVVVGEFNNDASRAFVYDPLVGGMAGLTRLAGDNDRGVAHDVNNAGVIVGASSNGVATRATQWAHDGAAYVATDLGSLDGLTTTPARATAVNQKGDAAGYSRDTSADTSQATLWDSGSVVGLGSLGDGDQFSQALGLNDKQVVVGSSYTGQTVGDLLGTTSTTAIVRGFAWDAGTITELPPVNLYTSTNNGSTANYHSEARGVNNAGLVVGSSQRILGFGGVATLWQDGMPIDLNTLLPPDSDWRLRSAEGINDRGDIVGYGAFGGSTRGFLLTAIPEPSAFVLAAAGFGLARLIRRSRRQGAM